MKPNKYLFRAFSLAGISLLSFLLIGTTGASAHDLNQFTPVTTDQNQNNNSGNNDDNNTNDNNNNGGGGYIPDGNTGGGGVNNNGGGISTGGATAGATTSNNGSATVAVDSPDQTGNTSESNGGPDSKNIGSSTNTNSSQGRGISTPSTQGQESPKKGVSASPNQKSDGMSKNKNARTRSSKTYKTKNIPKGQSSIKNLGKLTPKKVITTGSGGNWHWKYWYRGPNGEANSQVDKDAEVFATSFWHEYKNSPGKGKETTLKVKLAKSMIEKNKSSNRKLVRTIKAIERRKHLYYSVIHYKDNDGLASYELTVIKFYLNKKHTRYVGHRSVLETRNF